MSLLPSVPGTALGRPIPMSTHYLRQFHRRTVRSVRFRSIQSKHSESLLTLAGGNRAAARSPSRCRPRRSGAYPSASQRGRMGPQGSRLVEGTGACHGGTGGEQPDRARPRGGAGAAAGAGPSAYGAGWSASLYDGTQRFPVGLGPVEAIGARLLGRVVSPDSARAEAATLGRHGDLIAPYAQALAMYLVEQADRA